MVTFVTALTSVLLVTMATSVLIVKDCASSGYNVYEQKNSLYLYLQNLARIYATAGCLYDQPGAQHRLPQDIVMQKSCW